MAKVGKYEFAKEINVSVSKLDELMKTSHQEYGSDILDKRKQVLDDATQKVIRDLIK